MKTREESRFGKALHDARRAAAVTQDRLADQLGRPKSWVVDVERGRTLPTDGALIQALAYYTQADPLVLWAAMLEDASQLPSSMAEAPPDWRLLGETMMVGASAEPQIVRARPASYQKIEQDAEWMAERLFPLEVQHGTAIPVLDVLVNPTWFVHSAGLPGPVAPEVHDYGSGDNTIEGYTTYDSRTGDFVVSLRADVLDRAEQGEGRSRFTIAHELGHLALHHSLLRDQLVPAFRDEVCSASQKLAPGVRPYESPEWQASSWAGAFLMPLKAVRAFIQSLAALGHECTIEDLANRFQVSMQAARIRLEKLLPRLALGTGDQTMAAP